MVALCSLLEDITTKAAKSDLDYSVMLNTLLCLKALMNVELGMEAMVGGAAWLKTQEEMFKAQQHEEAAFQNIVEDAVSGLTRLAQCLETKHDSVAACNVQKEALVLLGGAVKYSEEAHTITLTAFDALKKDRRMAQRFSDLVDSLQPATASRDGPQLVVAQNQVMASTLLLINSLINSPAELKTRVKIRSEFIQLKLLDVLSVISQVSHRASPRVTVCDRM